MHPKSRVYTIKIGKEDHKKFLRKRGTSSREPSDKYLTTESEPSDGDDSDDDEAKNDEDYDSRQTRTQKSRAAKTRGSGNMRQTQLPFSPKKTRSGGRKRKPILSEDESDSEPRIQRRSGRNKGAAIRYDEDYEEDELDESDYQSAGKSRKKAKKVFKKRGPKPAYGTVRSIEDLDNSDDESAPLRAHRDFCEKCKEPPAHILMTQAKRKRGRKKAKEDEDEESDGERASKLGGWVRW